MGSSEQGLSQQAASCLQPDIASQRGALQLLDALDRKGGKTPAHPASPHAHRLPGGPGSAI